MKYESAHACDNDSNSAYKCGHCCSEMCQCRIPNDAHSSPMPGINSRVLGGVGKDGRVMSGTE